jgi:endonuclease YncB( thermonuclease family)
MWNPFRINRQGAPPPQQPTYYGAPRQQPTFTEQAMNLPFPLAPIVMLIIGLCQLVRKLFVVLCILFTVGVATWGILWAFGFRLNSVAALPSPKKLAVAARNAAREFASTAGDGVLLYPGETDHSEHARIIRVMDGDTMTVEVLDKNGRPVREEIVRLLGIDAPEVRENDNAERQAKRREVTVYEIIRQGELSKKHAQVHAPEGTAAVLEYDSQEKDVYGRLLVYLWVDFDGDGNLDYMLNQVMLNDGMAWAYMDSNLRYTLERQAERILDGK